MQEILIIKINITSNNKKKIINFQKQINKQMIVMNKIISFITKIKKINKKIRINFIQIININKFKIK